MTDNYKATVNIPVAIAVSASDSRMAKMEAQRQAYGLMKNLSAVDPEQEPTLMALETYQETEQEDAGNA